MNESLTIGGKEGFLFFFFFCENNMLNIMDIEITLTFQRI